MKVLKFGAPWCSGCLVMKPRWEEIEKENSWLETKYYDFVENKDKFEEYNVNDILPTFIFIDKNDNEIIRLSGEVDKNKLIEIINQNREK